jgi:hypothetical protein
MQNLVKAAVEQSTVTTLACLKIYCTMLGVSKALGIDELSHRSDKERYLITVIFNYGLVEPLLSKLNSDEFSPALEKIVNDLHDSIKKEKDIKNKLFKTIEMDAIDSLETCIWLSRHANDEVMHAIIITAVQVNYLLSNKVIVVPDTSENKKIIKNGSRCKINHNIFAAITYIFQDKNLRIANFSEGIKRG